MYAFLDKYTKEFTIALPEKLNDYFSDLSLDISDKFGFEPMNKDTVEAVNQYIIDWFYAKGIELPKQKESKKDNNEQLAHKETREL